MSLGASDHPAAGPGPGAGSRGAPASGTRSGSAPPYGGLPHRLLQRPLRLLTHHVLLRVRVSGLANVPPAGPLLLAGNHAGWLDGPLVVIEAPRTVRCLVKSELYTGVLGRLLTLAGQIPVNRGRPDRTALHAALDELGRGGAVGVFPEGTRGTGELETVQHGIAYLAVHGRAPVLPVVCLGTGEALPKGAHRPRRSVPIDVVFGEPFTVEVPANPRSRRALAAVAEDIRVRLAAHLTAARAGRR